MPTDAAEEWSTAVNTAPTTTPMKGLVNAVRMEVNSGMSARGLTAFFIIVVPYIRMAKPTMMEPMLCFWPVLYFVRRMTPARAIRGEKFSGLRSWRRIVSLSMPDRDRIHAVRVVPTLEPMMMPMLWPSSRMPELTRPTSMTVTAPEDWMAIVMPAPSSRPLMGVEVIFLISCSMRPPASFSSRVDMRDMP